jgi:hypothetical protein
VGQGRHESDYAKVTVEPNEREKAFITKNNDGGHGQSYRVSHISFDTTILGSPEFAWPDCFGAFRMMDGAYFTGRKEILEWINESLSIGITKIEQTATGAIACALLDAHFPGSVALGKVNWDCRNEYEYTSNYKILQAAFNKLNITKKAEIERLSRGKYQDNLEVCSVCVDFSLSACLTSHFFSTSSCNGSKGFARAMISANLTILLLLVQKEKVQARLLNCLAPPELRSRP